MSKFHVRTPILTSRLRPKAAAATRLVGLALAVGILTVMVHATANRALVSLFSGEVTIGLARTPVWPARAIIPIGLTALTLEYILMLVKNSRILFGEAPPEDARDSDHVGASPVA